MSREFISRVYRVIVISCLLAGIAINIARTTSVVAILSYYTLQSNIICLIVFIGIEVASFTKKGYQDSDVYYLVKGCVMITILITAIVYAVALAPIGFQMDNIGLDDLINFLSNLLVHIISPSLVILDYFFFDKKGRFKLYYPGIWLVIPLNYLIYVYTYSAMGGQFFGIGGSERFGYIFLDYTIIGYIGVAEVVIGMVVAIILISFLFVLLDRKLGNRKKKNQHRIF